jgi:RND family efflux transporter MFP subunit
MRKLWILVSCIALVAIALTIYAVLVATAPKAEKKRPPKSAALVEVKTLERSDEIIVLELTGTVTPAEEVMMRARVNGEVIAIAPSFIDGGLLKKGEEAVRIDPVDYELALATAKSALETARFNYKLELGRQDVAKREWELLKTDNATEQEKELALRIPHLAASKAALEAAEANLLNAELDLQRTTIRAPFNAIVRSRNVNIGSQASLQDVLASLAGTDAYWVLASIPVDRLEWIEIPGSTARILSPSGAVREGQVIRLLADLEEKGRMARILIEVNDPLCLQPENADRKPLLIGEYVQTKISGRKLENVYSIPRNALHDNRNIWIAAEDNTLDLREIKVLWRDEQRILIRDGISDGTRLIVSDLTAPVQGMDLNTGDNGE